MRWCAALLSVMTATAAHASYVGGNPLNNVDPTGLATAVVVGGPAGANIFGHVAIGFTGQGIYSYGTPDPFGASFTGYLAGQAAYRNSTVYILPTTPAQEQAMQQYIMANYAHGRPYSIWRNHDCASMVNGALGTQGIGEADILQHAQNGVLYMPMDPVTAAERAASYPGVQTISIPEGGAIPGIMGQFNPSGP